MRDILDEMIQLNKSISEDKRKLQAINTTMYDLKGKNQDLSGVHASRRDAYLNVDKTIDTKEILKNRIKDNSKSLDILKKDLINNLKSINDDLMIDIMYLRYIDFFTWSSICKILNYSRSRIFQKHNHCIYLLNKNKKD